ncbi:unnamed protein product [Amoebophrya sp. A120]|nr:unnamed protein product [Amoebophrya sp. A120]|eukprot:GSA120T00024079001.1
MLTSLIPVLNLPNFPFQQQSDPRSNSWSWFLLFFPFHPFEHFTSFNNSPQKHQVHFINKNATSRTMSVLTQVQARLATAQMQLELFWQWLLQQLILLQDSAMAYLQKLGVYDILFYTIPDFFRNAYAAYQQKLEQIATALKISERLAALEAFVIRSWLKLEELTIYYSARMMELYDLYTTNLANWYYYSSGIPEAVAKVEAKIAVVGEEVKKLALQLSEKTTKVIEDISVALQPYVEKVQVLVQPYVDRAKLLVNNLYATAEQNYNLLKSKFPILEENLPEFAVLLTFLGYLVIAFVVLLVLRAFFNWFNKSAKTATAKKRLTDALTAAAIPVEAAAGGARSRASSRTRKQSEGRETLLKDNASDEAAPTNKKSSTSKVGENSGTSTTASSRKSGNRADNREKRLAVPTWWSGQVQEMGTGLYLVRTMIANKEMLWLQYYERKPEDRGTILAYAETGKKNLPYGIALPVRNELREALLDFATEAICEAHCFRIVLCETEQVDGQLVWASSKRKNGSKIEVFQVLPGEAWYLRPTEVNFVAAVESGNKKREPNKSVDNFRDLKTSIAARQGCSAEVNKPGPCCCGGAPKPSNFAREKWIGDFIVGHSLSGYSE